MELTTLYRLIGLQPEIVERLKPFHNGSDRMRLGPYLERLTMPETAQKAYLSLKEVLGEDPDGLAMLYCQLEAARQVYRRYQEKGIPERIFVDTMRWVSHPHELKPKKQKQTRYRPASIT